MSKKFKLRNFIRNQFPTFVKEDHGNFIAFMESFYEWLDNDVDNIRNVSQLENLFDIDETLDLFIEDFKKTYLASFPINLVLNPTTGERLSAKKLLKNIKDFYKAKGIPASYSFIFRLLYNSEIEIYYPKEFIFRLSDGRWQKEKKLFLNIPNPFDVKNLKNVLICQREQDFNFDSQITARARVVSSTSYNIENFRVNELLLEDVYGEFEVGKKVYDTTTNQIYGEPYSILSKISLDDGGVGYEENQKINFSEISRVDDGYLPKARIKRVITSTNENRGKVLELEILDYGLNINESNCALNSSNPVEQLGLTGGTGFSATISFGAIAQETEYYLNNQGLLSSNMVFQDNFKYQDYSYVIRSDMSISRYVDTIKGLLHPAGMELLAETVIKRCLNGFPDLFTNIAQRQIKRIGNYLPYTFFTFDNLPKWFRDNCYSIEHHDPMIINCDAPEPFLTPGCVTGNPITSFVPFSPGATCVTADLPIGSTPDYWVTFPHPNIRISEAVGNIYLNQLGDFYGPTSSGLGQSSSGWQEWNLSDFNEGTTTEQEEWLEDFLNTGEDKAFATLRINSGTSFRKIPIYAFLDDINCSFDCRYTNTCLQTEKKDIFNENEIILGNA